MTLNFHVKRAFQALMVGTLMILGSLALTQGPGNFLSADQLMLNSIVSANSDFESPVQLSWFYKPPKDGSSMNYLANNFDYYVLTKNDESQRDYLQDRGFDVLQYTRLDVIHDPCFQADDPQGTTCNCNRQPLNNQVAWHANDICFIRDNHRDWFLRDKNGNLIYSSQGRRDEVIMDPGRKGWRDFWLNRMRESQSTGWDGIFIDNMATTFTRHGANPVDLRDYTRQEWRNTIADYLRYVRRGYFEDANKEMFANLSVYWNEDDTYFQFLQYLDGTMDEHWAVLGNDAGVYSRLSWERRILRAEETLAQGKNMILVSRGSRSDHHRRNFAMASYLLVDRGNGFFRYTRQGNYDEVWLYDDYDIPLGDPVGTYFRSGDNWVRNFENGRVSVNPSNYTYNIQYDVAPPQIFDEFALFEGGSDNEIRTLSSGVSLSSSEAEDINIRVGIAGGDPGSVTLRLSGPTNVTRVERYAPYSLMGDYGNHDLLSGNYTLSATSSNDPANPLLISFSVGEKSGNEAPTVSINADKSTTQTSNNNVTFSLTANADDPDGSVESYMWSNGSNNSTISITVEPGSSRTISVHVVDNDGTSSNTASVTLRVNRPSSNDGPEVTSLTLIDAIQDTTAGELRAGTDIVWPDAQNFNVRANVDGGDPGSVQFQLRGRVNYNRTERQPVYALFGNSGSDYYKGSLPVGQYTLEVIPTNNPDGTLLVEFDVVSSGNRELESYTGISWQLPNRKEDTDNAEYYNIVFSDADYNILSDEWYEASQVCLDESCDSILARADLPASLTNGSYLWWIRSWSSDTDTSDWSSEGALVISAPTPVLVPLTMTTQENYLELTWREDPNTEWMQIYIGTTDGSEVYRQWVPTEQTTCVDTICRFVPDVVPSVGNYEVYLQAWGLGGFAGGSADSWNGPTNMTVNAPFLPRNLQVNVANHSLTWDASPGATEYEIWVGTLTPQQSTLYSERQSAEALGCLSNSVCILNLSNIVPSGEYDWFVRSWNTAGASQGGVEGWATGPKITW